MALTDLSSLFGLPVWMIAITVVWLLVWKGLALWKSARKGSPVWFIVLLVVNTMGILEILYIFLFSEIKLDKRIGKRARKK